MCGDDLALFEGDGNSEKNKECGISLKIEFDEKYQAEYEQLVESGNIKTVPIEYSAIFVSFAQIVPPKAARGEGRGCGDRRGRSRGPGRCPGRCPGRGRGAHRCEPRRGSLVARAGRRGGGG